jgi:hypothetical protein
MQKSQNTIVLQQVNDSLCNSHVYIYECIFPLIEFICLHHVDHILTPVLRQILIGYELHCCHVSDFVVIIELFPCCNCIPTLLQCLRLISSVDWSLIHVAHGHVTGGPSPP